MKTTIVATFRYRHEAELAKQILSDFGIESILLADDSGGMRPELLMMRPIRLAVLAGDEQRAREVLGEHELNGGDAV
jgi:hypothetical protein